MDKQRSSKNNTDTTKRKVLFTIAPYNVSNPITYLIMCDVLQGILYFSAFNLRLKLEIWHVYPKRVYQ